jgi:iron complex transport system substrate-binding protein
MRSLRIVSVCPSNTDLMAHLGILNWVIGRDSWSDWPEGEVESIPIIGSVLNIDIQAVEELRPELILASRNVPGMEHVVPKLEATGFPVVVYDPETWRDVLDNLRDLGARVGLSDRAEQVIDDALREVASLQQSTQDLPWLDVLVEWWPDPFIVPFEETYVNEVLSWVKARTPFRHTAGRSGKVPKQAILEANPDLYAISWCGTPFTDYDLSSVYRRFEGSHAAFVTQPNRVFKLWEGIIGHPSLRLLDGAKCVLRQRREMGL